MTEMLRREFLRRLGIGVGAALAAPAAVRGLLAAEAPVLPAAGAVAAPSTALARWTRLVALGVERELGWRRVRTVPYGVIGAGGLRRQYHVDFLPGDTAWARPHEADALTSGIGTALGRRVREDGWRVFGTSSIPTGIDEVAVVTLDSGVTVRGLALYDVQRDEFLGRFDVVGG